MELVNADMSASTKRERWFPIIDRNPSFSKVVRNFNSVDYFVTTFLAGIFVPCAIPFLAASRRSTMKNGIRGLATLSGNGLLFGFDLAFQNSADRLMGFSPNHNEVAKLNKREMEKINEDITAPPIRRFFVMSNADITLKSFVMSSLAALLTAGEIKPAGFRISSLATLGLVFGATYAPVNFACRLIYILTNDDEIEQMNTNYPIIDAKPYFSKVVGNFNMLDYLRIPATTGFSVITGYHFGHDFGMKSFLGMKSPLRGRNMVACGLLGMLFGFGYSYIDSTGRLMGVFPNDDEVAKFNKK